MVQKGMLPDKVIEHTRHVQIGRVMTATHPVFFRRRFTHTPHWMDFENGGRGGGGGGGGGRGAAGGGGVWSWGRLG